MYGSSIVLFMCACQMSLTSTQLSMPLKACRSAMWLCQVIKCLFACFAMLIVGISSQLAIVRHRVKELVECIQNDDRLREERKKAKKTKDKYVGMSGTLENGSRYSE